MHMSRFLKARRSRENFLKVLLMYPIHHNVKKLFSGKKQEKEMNLRRSVILLNYLSILMKKDSKKLDLQHQLIIQSPDLLLINILKSLT
jgi:hypothetical protein